MKKSVFDLSDIYLWSEISKPRALKFRTNKV